jgi:hypothetical protein
VRDARIMDMHASPGRTFVAMTVRITTQSLRFYASFLQTVVVASASL